MEAIERRGLLQNMKWAPAPLQIILCGVILTFATPMCCAIYPQITPVSIDKLESELQVHNIYICTQNYIIFIRIIIKHIIILHIL